jgi:hypothetical protein
MDDRDGAPWVAFPERLDRPMRLGPFASGRDAVKFVTGAAIGVVVGATVDILAGVLIAAGTALLVLWRPDGEPLDQRLLAVLRWLGRRSRAGGAVSAPRPAPRARGAGVARLADGRMAAILRCGGAPLAYLPPADLASQFERYRELLRSLGSGVVFVATTSPIHAASLCPDASAKAAPEAAARDGYRELVGLLGRRRPVRRVYVAVRVGATGPDGARELETAATLLGDRFGDLGVPAERLRDAALLGALQRLGWEGSLA